MVQRRTPPKRPASPGRSRSSGGSRVSGSVSVAPKFTLFGGSLLSFTFGGRGGRRGTSRRGGALKRAGSFLATGLRGLSGKDTTSGKIGHPGMTTKADRPGGADSFARFRDSRPELFDSGAGHPDITVEAQDLLDVVDADVVDDVPATPDRSLWLTRQIDPPGGAR